MPLDLSPELRTYDEAAQAEMRRLIGEERVAEALEFLAEHVPRDRAQRVDYVYVRGIVQITVGNYRGARAHLIHALRLTSRHPERRATVRTKLVWLLYKTGEMHHAERQFHRALREIHAESRDRGQVPWLMVSMASLTMNRGDLARAGELCEQAIQMLGSTPSDEVCAFSARLNMILSLSERGDLDRAGRLIEEGLAAPVPEKGGWRLAHLELARTVHALYCEDYEACAAALDRAEALTSGSNLRTNVLVRQYRAEMALALGQAAEVLPEIESLLQHILDTAPHGDHLPMTFRLLAQALQAVGRNEEALDRARVGARVARFRDNLEWCECMRVAGLALAALGRTREAQAAFAEVLSFVASTDFHIERRKVDRSMAACGLAVAPAPESAATPAAPRRPARREDRGASLAVSGGHRLTLADGKVFFTRDESLVAQIRLASRSRLPALIEGETGTGKERVARLIHELGPEPSRPFVVVDCTTLPESLAEAELFGAARGAFTGAISARPGLVASADGGTLFLDELPELSPAVQAKLLRVVQDGEYRRVGEESPRRARLRVIAATNRDVETLVLRGEFKPDLFYRLNGHRLQLRPLRERTEEIAALAELFVRDAGLPGVTDKAAALLQRLPWPGNVRQLEMAVKVAAIAAPDGKALGTEGFEHLADAARETAGGNGGSYRSAGDGALRGSRLEAEREVLRRALERHQGNVAAAARDLAMSRQGLYKALKRVGLM